MALHIVTNRCFLACEKVTSVVIEELIADKLAPRKRKKRPKGYLSNKSLSKYKVKALPSTFQITISYYPLAYNTNSNTSFTSSTGSREEYSLDIRVVGKDVANKLYAEIIKEVQEQHPNEGYLDRLVSAMLEGEDFKILEPQVSINDD